MFARQWIITMPKRHDWKYSQKQCFKCRKCSVSARVFPDDMILFFCRLDFLNAGLKTILRSESGKLNC
eukprot:7890185-Pyramimonas_sp.AAC.1